MATSVRVSHADRKLQGHVGCNFRGGIARRFVSAPTRVKPIDAATLIEAAYVTGAIVTVEDHCPFGGLGDAVLQALADRLVPVTVLAVGKRPMSGSGDELRDFEGISARAILSTVKRLIRSGNTANCRGRPRRR